MSELQPTDQQVLAHTRAWVDRAVIGLNLCPFARSVQASSRLHYQISHARSPEPLLEDLAAALDSLTTSDPQLIETSLLIAPFVLEEFVEFNDFLSEVDALLGRKQLDGLIQVASFHPDYQFAGTAADDPGNASNRSPYPCLHLLRESSIDRAVASGADAASIVSRNLNTLETLGAAGWARLEAACRRDADLPSGDRPTHSAMQVDGENTEQEQQACHQEEHSHHRKSNRSK